ncbi:putative brca1 c terminus domain-containing protein [Erysiphe necator]|uniref:Putative brca1 c terminus domain-containing protein n=1 Tax=Uncinula necator TaxID=52586 RepID=A0A0B1NZ49_UNCNE|nr:putative brca1 c terminus domain-containing protein [Erysiphe necator]
MLISLTVGKVDAGVAVLLTQDKRLIEFPSILLPPNISSGSIVDITVSRNFNSEQKAQANFLALQDSIHSSFGVLQPAAPVLRCRNATQTSIVLEWDLVQLATADIISLSLFRNGQKAGNIPRPEVMQSTKISGLGIDTEYTFHLVLRTTAGTYNSERVMVRTHKMTDLSGITITPGILPPQLRDSLTRAIERIGAKMADSVRIDTTHFVTTEGHGSAWEKAVDMNIPVVRPEWIEGCEAGGRIVGVRQYYLDADPRQRQMVPTEVSTQFQEPIKNSPIPFSPESESGKSHSLPPTPPIKDKKFHKEEKPNGRKDSGEEQYLSLQNNQSQVENKDTSNLKHQDHTPHESPHQNPTPSPSIDDCEDDNREKKSEPVEEEKVLPETSSFQDVAL